MFFPSMALYGEFWDGELKNVLSFMQAAGNKEEEEERRTGCGSQAGAPKGRRSFVICGSWSQKRESAPSFARSTPTNQAKNWGNL